MALSRGGGVKAAPQPAEASGAARAAMANPRNAVLALWYRIRRRSCVEMVIGFWVAVGEVHAKRASFLMSACLSLYSERVVHVVVL